MRKVPLLTAELADILVSKFEKLSFEPYEIEALLASSCLRVMEIKYIELTLENDGFHGKAEIVRDALSKRACTMVNELKGAITGNYLEVYFEAVSDDQLFDLISSVEILDCGEETKERDMLLELLKDEESRRLRAGLEGETARQNPVL